jgi:hypothetical protein
VGHRWIGIFAIIACVALGETASCDRSPATPTTKAMTTEEIIRQKANTPVGQSIVPIARSLAKRTVFVATESAPSTVPTTITFDKLRFRTARDNQGRLWAYTYTTQAELC